jgi:hypothetical protein
MVKNPPSITTKACLTTKACNFLFLLVQTVRRVVTRYFTHIALAARSIRIWDTKLYTDISKTYYLFPYAPVHILPEGDPEAQGLRAGWGAAFEWFFNQGLTTQIGIVAGVVAVGYITYKIFFSSDGGGPGGGGPGGDDDEGGANEPDHQEAPGQQDVQNPVGNENPAALPPVDFPQANPQNPPVIGNFGGNNDLGINEQPQHQPQADVEVVVQVEQHPEAAEQPISAAQAEVEGEEPILHEPIPQGDIIAQPEMNPQGAIINADQAIIVQASVEVEVEGQQPNEPAIDPQGAIIHAEQVEAIAQQMVAIVQAEGQEPMIPAEQEGQAVAEQPRVDGQHHEPNPQGAIITPQGQVSAIFHGDVAQLGVIAAATIAGDVRQSTHDTRDTRKTRRQRSTPDARKTPEAITTRLPILGENVPFPRETITTLNRPSAVESLMTQPSQVPTIPQPTAEAMPSTDTTPQMPETQAIVTPQSSTSTTNTLTKSAKRKLKEREKAKAKVEAEALAKAEAEAKKGKEAEKGKSKETSTASSRAKDVNNNNNQATSSRDISKDRIPAAFRSNTEKIDSLKFEVDFKMSQIQNVIVTNLDSSFKEHSWNWKLWLLCNRYNDFITNNSKDAEKCLGVVKSLIIYIIVKQLMSTYGKNFYEVNILRNAYNLVYYIPKVVADDVLKFTKKLLADVPNLNCISDAELGNILRSLFKSIFDLPK